MRAGFDVRRLRFVTHEDLPSEWPWGQADKTEPAPPPAGKGRGKGRGRGRGRGRAGKDEPAPSEPKQKQKQQTQRRQPSLLTNLVRTGNQMSNAGSWRIVHDTLKKTISIRISIKPISSLPAGSEERKEQNRGILSMLGKVFDPGSSGHMPPKGLFESANELLEFPGCIFFVGRRIHLVIGKRMVACSSRLLCVSRTTLPSSIMFDMQCGAVQPFSAQANQVTR